MPSKWVTHVKTYYHARKKKEAGYKYSSAMKDARATYHSDKKGKKAEPKAEPKEEPKKAKAKRKKAPKKKAKKPPRDPAEPAAAPKKKKKRKLGRAGPPKDFTSLN
jgi:hypothetical protein